MFRIKQQQQWPPSSFFEIYYLTWAIIKREKSFRKYKFKYLGVNELKTFYVVAAKVSSEAYKLSKIHIKEAL